MIIGKNKEKIYVKKLDNIDAYLVNIIKRFFETDQQTLWINREEIILEAVKRAKEDFVNNPGHFAVTSVNGMGGNVTITTGNIGAEPAILNKRNAFNKDYGSTRDTVCAGDDPRLSDARDPLPHTHNGEFVEATDLDTAIEEFLNKKGIYFTNNKISIINKDLDVVNGKVSEV